MQWRQEEKQEVEHGYHDFEALCGTRSVHFPPYVLWIEGRYHAEGKGKGTASLHSSMPIFMQRVRSNHREQSGVNPEGFAASSPLTNHPHLGAWTAQLCRSFSKNCLK